MDSTTQNAQTARIRLLPTAKEAESSVYQISRKIKGYHFNIIRQTNNISIESISKLCQLKPDVIEYLEGKEQDVPMEMVEALNSLIRDDSEINFDLNFNNTEHYKSLLIMSLTGKPFKEYQKLNLLESKRIYALKNGFNLTK